jgi:hypothetical protein
MAVTELGHHASRSFTDQDGCPHLNGATFYVDGTTGNNNFVLTDNLADALNIKEGANSYLKITTTNSGETITVGVNLTIADEKNIVLNTTTGTKIGTATTQKIGFWNATPVIQQASAAQAAVTPSTDFTGADTVDKAVVLAAVQAVETLVNRLRLDLVTTGIIKGSA